MLFITTHFYLKQTGNKIGTKSSFPNKDGVFTRGETKSGIVGQIPVNNTADISFSRNKNCQDKGNFCGMDRQPVSQDTYRDRNKSTLTSKSVMSVSYTHLDVYKRQSFHC